MVCAIKECKLETVRDYGWVGSGLYVEARRGFRNKAGVLIATETITKEIPEIHSFQTLRSGLGAQRTLSVMFAPLDFL